VRVHERRGGDEKGRRDADDVAEAASALSLVGDVHMHHIADLRVSPRISLPVPRKYLTDSHDEDETRLNDELN